jgi:predicted transposase/invertase (TIGR01784 family)
MRTAKDILAALLTAILGVEIIEDELVYIQTEVRPKFKDDKEIILDIHVASSKSHDKMNIEMQLQDQGDVAERILYYWASSFAQVLKKKQKYKDLPKQINILIANFDIFEWQNEKKVCSKFKVLETEEMKVLSDLLEIHVLELPKLLKLTKNEILKESILRWMAYLSNIKGKTMQEIAKREPMIRKAITLQEIFVKDEIHRRQYLLREKATRDYAAAVDYAREKGEEKGEERGIKKGIIITAKNLLSMNLPLNQIVQATGLSLSEIKKIKKSM